VLVFGGSYGGFLAAMMRITHGDLVFAAVASAAPVQLTGSAVDTGLWCDAALPSLCLCNTLAGTTRWRA
jgi:homoserine acetyltransferase